MNAITAIDGRRPSFRFAKRPDGARAIAADQAHEARERLQSLLFALEIAGVDCTWRETVREAIDDLELLIKSL